jgi:hypothetical protein
VNLLDEKRFQGLSESGALIASLSEDPGGRDRMGRWGRAHLGCYGLNSLTHFLHHFEHVSNRPSSAAGPAAMTESHETP